VNVLFLLYVVGFSGLAYPAGYFSELRKAIIRATPTHYATVIVRSTMLRELSIGAFADWLLGLGVVGGGPCSSTVERADPAASAPLTPAGTKAPTAAGRPWRPARSPWTCSAP